MNILTKFGQKSARTCVGLAAAVATCLLPLQSMAQDLKDVKIGVGTRVMGITYPWLNLPQVLGYWKEEGYEVEVIPLGASLEVIQQMVAGSVDIGQINMSAVIQSNVNNGIPLRGVMVNSPMDWAVSTLAGSDIQSISDLKGKTIGVYSLASGSIPYLRSFLASNGVDPDNDVTLVATGFGAPPMVALKNNDVQALMYWSSANVGFENAGLDLRYFRDPIWTELPDFSLVSLENSIQNDPEMIEGIVRGATKALVFAQANPECVLKIHWETWPDTTARNSDEDVAKSWDMKALETQLTNLQDWYDHTGSGLWGSVDASDFDRLQNLLRESGVIEGTLDAGSYGTGVEGFYEKVNDFDHAAIVAQAKACEY